MADAEQRIRDRLARVCSHLDKASFEELVQKIAANEKRIPQGSLATPWDLRK